LVPVPAISSQNIISTPALGILPAALTKTVEALLAKDSQQ
jgi:hypothetical protein